LPGHVVIPVPQRSAAVLDHRYIGIDTTHLDVPETVRQITSAIPAIYGRRPA
jgi:hypothetical protein